MAKGNGEWLEAIAKRAGTDSSRVEAVMASHRIVATPVLASPRRLMLLEIAFSGVKDGVADSGPFEFCWNSLGHGLWGMVTDQNLRGKSSVMEVVRWLLRGRPSDNLQEDVRRWIHKAHLRFSLDQQQYQISVEAEEGATGKLVRLKPAGGEVALAEFSTEREFEAVMADFFLRALAMDTIMTFRESKDPNESGQTVGHGWVAFSGAMFIGTNYEVLLGDMPVASGLNPRLTQMYLGVPWVSTLASAKSALQAVQNSVDLRHRKNSQGQAARQARVEQIKTELEASQHELSQLPSDKELRDRLAVLSNRYAEMKRKEQGLQQWIERDTRARDLAEAAYNEDRRDLSTHLDSIAADGVFRMLDPTCCPRCDHSIPESRKKQENSTHACAICGESIATNEDAQFLKTELEERVNASKTAFEKAVAELKDATADLTKIQESVTAMQVEIDEKTSHLGSFSRQQHLLTSIAVLEGRLQEAAFEPAAENDGKEGSQDELRILNAIVTETENRVKTVREDLLKDVSDRLVEYAQRFGMHSLSEASLKSNATLMLVKGGSSTSYSRVTDGEKLRLKVATVLAMIEVAEKRSVGRHPGLLMIDSPAAHEVAPEDLDNLVAGLHSVAETIPHIQVFVSGRISDAITQYIPEKNRREALNGGFLW